MRTTGVNLWCAHTVQGVRGEVLCVICGFRSVSNFNCQATRVFIDHAGQWRQHTLIVVPLSGTLVIRPTTGKMAK